MLYPFFWVIPRRLNFMCRRFGTPFLFHLNRRCKQKYSFLFIVAPRILITLKFLSPTNAPLYYTYSLHYSLIAETLFTNIAGHLTTYFYWFSSLICNFSKAQHRLPDDGSGGPKHVGATRDILTVGNKKVHLLVLRIKRKIDSYCLHRLWRWNRQSVAKFRHIKFKRRGITQKKENNIALSY
jgi:hypothetical protein